MKSKKLKNFLLGFSPSLEDSTFIETASAYRAVGDNTGNLAFCYAINRQLGGDLKSVLWHAEPKVIDSYGDIGVLTLANQLGQHANLGYLVDNFNQLQCSLVGLGLGAQAGNYESEVTIPEGTLSWIRSIQDHSISNKPNIAMRGEFSRRALERYGLADKAVVIGCPTLFINPNKKLGELINEKLNYEIKHIAVTAGHQKWAHLSRIENSLVSMAMTNKGAYICQSPIEMVKLGRGEATHLSSDDFQECKNYIGPYMSDDEFTTWANNYARTFFSTSAWMEYIRRYDFVIGTRIHGVMLALQSGVPGLCIAHDSRTVELCETMMVPYVHAKDVSQGIKRDDIRRYVKFDPVEFDKNRSKLAMRYIDFLVQNSLVPSPYLYDLIDKNA